jgi:hypothetical protein
MKLLNNGKIKIQIEDILFRNGVIQIENTDIFKLIDEHTKNVLLEFDKWCENYNFEDTKLTNEKLK